MSLPMKSGRIAMRDELSPAWDAVNAAPSGAPGATTIDRLWQTVYRLGYRLAKAWWFLRRPVHRGALAALWHDGEILVLYPSYRRVLNLPGGGIRPGEEALAAVLRECEEEIGLALVPGSLRPVHTGMVLWEYRYDYVTIFEATLTARPPLAVDHREIVAARFRPPHAIRPDEVAPHVRQYLAGKLNPSWPAASRSAPAT